MGRRALVYGLAVAGEATARALVARGWEVVVADDQPTADAEARAAALGARELHVTPSPAELRALVHSVELVAPSPGVPEGHALFTIARQAGVAVRSEIDLAYEWEQQRAGGPRPI